MMGRQGELFDGIRSELGKLRGMSLAESNRYTELEAARRYAIQLARRDGTVTADDVGVMFPNLGPAAGSLFRPSTFVWTGAFKKSVRVSNHSRLLRVWRLSNASL